MQRPARRQASGRLTQASDIAAWLGADIDDALGDIRVPAFILSRDGLIRWQNARAIEITGEARGRHFSSVLAVEAVHQARVEFAKQVIGTTRTSNRRTVMRSPDGTHAPVEVHTISLEDGTQVVGVFGIMELDNEHSSPAPLRGTLTPRQHQVLVELAHGASTQQIAESLGLARETVRNHVRGLLRALRVHSRLEAVAEARRRGLVDQ